MTANIIYVRSRYLYKDTKKTLLVGIDGACITMIACDRWGRHGKRIITIFLLLSCVSFEDEHIADE